jgi:2-amino-4-hydroxy-6-hydroxymethyldihydropteridine diphosphokinase
MTRVVAWVGLGANLGDPAQQLGDALRALHALPQSQVLAWSALYQSAAQGGPVQADYVNAVAKLETELAPLRFLQCMLDIERGAGRTRDGALNAPRTLDLDLLAYDDLQLDQDGLRLPHPRLHQRAFVLVPLLELGADFHIDGQHLQHWLKAASNQPVLRLSTPAVWTL